MCLSLSPEHEAKRGINELLGDTVDKARLCDRMDVSFRNAVPKPS